MELFGLKTKEGNEYKLIIDDEDLNRTHVRFSAIKAVTPEPEFKAGEWVIGKGNFAPRYPARILDISKYYFTYDSYDDKGTSNDLWRNDDEIFIRPCTPEEIESHLGKICDEKYVGKKAESLTWVVSAVVREFYEYNLETDSIWYWTVNNESPYRLCLYRKGRFAEIIPEKKRLPKTRKELKKVFEDYFTGTKNFTDFLKDYED